MIDKEFKIGDKVVILGIDVTGTVRAITKDVAGVNYKVSHWYEGAYKEVWLPADELEKK